MRIAAIADLHNTLPEMPEPADVLVIAGDFAYCRKGDVETELEWLNGPFREWAERQPAAEILIIAGNHDFAWESSPARVEALRLPVTYLQDSGVEISGVRFWGTPWQPPFLNWAFNAPELKLEERFSLIPEDTDVLISHGPPYGTGDRTERGELVGSHALTRRLKALPNLRYCFFGHIHEARGRWRKYGKELFNCSAVDLRYRSYPDPFYYIEL